MTGIRRDIAHIIDPMPVEAFFGVDRKVLTSRDADLKARCTTATNKADGILSLLEARGFLNNDGTGRASVVEVEHKGKVG